MPYINENKHADMLLDNIDLRNRLGEIKDLATACRDDGAGADARSSLSKIIELATTVRPAKLS